MLKKHISLLTQVFFLGSLVYRPCLCLLCYMLVLDLFFDQIKFLLMSLSKCFL